MPPRSLTMFLSSTSLKGSKKLIFEVTLTARSHSCYKPYKNGIDVQCNHPNKKKKNCGWELNQVYKFLGCETLLVETNVGKFFGLEC
jgi:hypothetical protein